MTHFPNMPDPVPVIVSGCGAITKFFYASALAFLEEKRVVRVAAVQLASGPSVAANLNEARRLIAMAAKQGARLARPLPEAGITSAGGSAGRDHCDELETDFRIRPKLFLFGAGAR